MPEDESGRTSLKNSGLGVTYFGAVAILYYVNLIIESYFTCGKPVSTKNVAEELAGVAVQDLGPMAPVAFERWGLKDWKTVGQVIYFWIAIKKLEPSPEDSLQHFLIKTRNLSSELEALVRTQYWPTLKARIGAYNPTTN